MFGASGVCQYYYDLACGTVFKYTIILILGLESQYTSLCQLIHVSWLDIIQVVTGSLKIHECDAQTWCLLHHSKALSALHRVTSPFLYPFILKHVIMSVYITILLVLKQLVLSLCIFPLELGIKLFFFFLSVIICVFRSELKWLFLFTFIQKTDNFHLLVLV